MKIAMPRCFVLVTLLAGFSFVLHAQTAVAPSVNTGVTDPNKWEKSIVAFEKSDAATPPPKEGVVFVGSSTLRLWKSLPEDFPEIPAINRGFGGSEMSDVVQYADRIVIPYDPRVVVVYCGGNDLFYKKTPDQVLADYKAFEAKVHAALPDATVIFITLNPTILRLNQEPLVRELNAKTKEFVATPAEDAANRYVQQDGRS